jgi:hypothetical protein
MLQHNLTLDSEDRRLLASLTQQVEDFQEKRIFSRRKPENGCLLYECFQKFKRAWGLSDEGLGHFLGLDPADIKALGLNLQPALNSGDFWGRVHDLADCYEIPPQRLAWAIVEVETGRPWMREGSEFRTALRSVLRDISSTDTEDQYR